MAVPTVDISAFTTSSISSSTLKRRDVADALIASLSANGCVGVTGHGLPPDLIYSAFSQMKKFFALPHDDKLQASASTSPGALPRGFTQAGIEHAGKSLEEKEGKAEQGAIASDYKVRTDQIQDYDIDACYASIEEASIGL